MLRVRLLACLLSAAVIVTPLNADAQFVERARLTTQDRVDNALANAAIGAVLGGVRAVINGRSIKSGFVRGAVGGSVHAAGKQIAARDASAAGLIGRTVNALGSAVIASATRDTLSVLLPLWAVNLEIVPRSGDRFRPRVNLWTTVIATVSAIDSRTTLDRTATWNTGAFVFETDSENMPWGSGEAGFAHPGVIFVNTILLDRPEDRQLTIAHEAVHILQWDAYHALVTRPVERAAIARIRGGAWMNRHVEFNLLGPATVWAIASRVNDESRPWEREAYKLTGESPERPVDQ